MISKRGIVHRFGFGVFGLGLGILIGKYDLNAYPWQWAAFLMLFGTVFIFHNLVLGELK